MTGLTAIENDPYASLISLILTKVDGCLSRVSSAMMSSIKNKVLSPANRLLIFLIKYI